MLITMGSAGRAVSAVSPLLLIPLRIFLCLSQNVTTIAHSHRPTTTHNNRQMTKLIKHIVMFRLREDATEDDLKSVKRGLLELPGKIPLIRSYELGVDLELPSGKASQSNVGGRNRTICWSATFASVEDYDAYHLHEAHKSFVQDVLAPVIEHGSRAAIQYAVDA